MAAVRSMRVRVFGGGVDARLVGEMLERSREVRGGIRVEYCDPVAWIPRPPGGGDDGVADCHVYVGVPVRMAIAWARFNVFVVAGSVSWDWVRAEMDLFVFKSPVAAATVGADVPAGRRLVVPWRSPMEADHAAWAEREERFLFRMGEASWAAARDLVAAWRAEWPPLEIWCTESAAAAGLRSAGGRIEFRTEGGSDAVAARQRACRWHVAMAEGYDHSFAEAAACGAPVLWLDTGDNAWNWDLGVVGRVSTRELLDETRVPESAAAIGMGVASLLALTPADVAGIQRGYRERRSEALRGFRDGWTRVIQRAVRGAHASGLPVAPPRGTVPPKVAVVTLTRNRADWWGNMVQNITGCAWPPSRLEWVVLDDSDDGGAALGPKIQELSAKVPFVVRYLPATRGATLGEKRNAAVAAASADCDVFVMMDDDDHYPAGSVATRLSWLTDPRVGAVYCSTIPMYDVRKYVSAMNVPPLGLSAAERVSEATLAFRRAFWEERGFPAVGIAEGEGFLAGREGQTREIPPVGVIVSFIHKGNTSSRRVPEEQEPNGCHYGFKDEYFTYLHTIGMEAEAMAE